MYRKRAKTDDEKEQRRIERVLRNRAAAQTSRERKRLEMEKLEGEKVVIEQQNEFLLQRLTQMETENGRLNKQVAQLSAEVRASRGNTPNQQGSSASSTSSASESPTLTATLFKQEGDEPSLDRIPFPTPSLRDNSPTLEPSSLVESSDLAQHPAAVLCGLQCQSVDSKEQETLSPLTTSNRAESLSPLMKLQLLFLMMTSVAYSTVIQPLSQILRSLKMGSPLTFSTEEIYRYFPLILWLISTPSLSISKTSSRPTVFRMRLLARLLACSPALARPLRDATGRALQLAVSEHVSQGTWLRADASEGRQHWELLLTLAWAIDCLGRSRNKRRQVNGLKSSSISGRRIGRGRSYGGIRSSRSSGKSEILRSLLKGKHY